MYASICNLKKNRRRNETSNSVKWATISQLLSITCLWWIRFEDIKIVVKLSSLLFTKTKILNSVLWVLRRNKLEAMDNWPVFV